MLLLLLNINSMLSSSSSNNKANKQVVPTYNLKTNSHNKIPKPLPWLPPPILCSTHPKPPRPHRSNSSRSSSNNNKPLNNSNNKRQRPPLHRWRPCNSNWPFCSNNNSCNCNSSFSSNKTRRKPLRQRHSNSSICWTDWWWNNSSKPWNNGRSEESPRTRRSWKHQGGPRKTATARDETAGPLSVKSTTQCHTRTRAHSVFQVPRKGPPRGSGGLVVCVSQ
mmetsp:Transcript_5173/g.10644  ORF Transcript_5173/g.10644 Transcript_5173/m.10644 type:complete len:221 (-) Transcript_5173:178-840(-)